MDTTALYTRQPAAPAGDLAPQLFISFIEWIDRSATTARTYSKNLRTFAAWLKYTGTRQPGRADIILYRDWLTTEHEAIALDPAAPAGWKYREDRAGQPLRIKCKPNTTALYLRSVKQFFKWTAAAGYYPNIAENIHAPKVDSRSHKKDALTPAQVLKIENSIKQQAAERIREQSRQKKDTAGRLQRQTEQGKRLFAIFLLAVNAGLRTIEISRANCRDIETKDGRAVIYIWGKGRTEADAKIPLAPPVYDAICDYIKSRKDRPTGASPLFVSTGNRSGGQRIAATTISAMLKEAMRAAGYDSERLTAHSLRHSTAQGIMRVTNRNIYEAQGYMRHIDPKTTEIYLTEDEETDERRADLARRLYDLYHGTECPQDARADISQQLDQLNSEQLKTIAGIVAAMT